jgi:hypothetical protein
MTAYTTHAQTPADGDRAQQAREWMQGLLARSAIDPGFRAKLLSEPRAALAEFTGHEPAGALNIKFIENQGGRLTVVLPDPIESQRELSAEELESVAGGTSPAWWALAAACLAVYDQFIDG